MARRRSWPLGMTRAAATPEDGRQAVRDAKAEGYEFIKVYSKLTLETFTAIVDEARQQHMRVVGHIPQRDKGITEKFFHSWLRPGGACGGIRAAHRSARSRCHPALRRHGEAQWHLAGSHALAGRAHRRGDAAIRNSLLRRDELRTCIRAPYQMVDQGQSVHQGSQRRPHRLCSERRGFQLPAGEGLRRGGHSGADRHRCAGAGCRARLCAARRVRVAVEVRHEQPAHSRKHHAPGGANGWAPWRIAARWRSANAPIWCCWTPIRSRHRAIRGASRESSSVDTTCRGRSWIAGSKSWPTQRAPSVNVRGIV